MATPGTDGNAQSHFTSARGGLRNHQIGDVCAGDEKDEQDKNAESEEGAAIVLLKAGSAGRGGREIESLIEFAGDFLRSFVDPGFGAFGFKGMRDGIEFGTERFDSDAGLDNGEGAMPGGIFSNGVRMHHGGKKDVGHGAGFSAGERSLGDADDLKDVVADPESLAENVGIVGEAARPVIVRDDGDGMTAGSGVVIWIEEAAEGGLQAEGGEHVAGNVLEIGFLHFLIRFVGEVDAVGVRDGKEIGLAFGGVAHELEIGIGPAVEVTGLAVGIGPVTGEGVELFGVGDGKWAKEERVDQAESGRAGADGEGEGEDGSGGGDLFLASWRKPKVASKRRE